jgi:hypothetical protein
MTDILQEAVNALVLAKGNKSEAARALSLPRPTLVSRLEKAKLNNIKPTAKAPDTEAALTEQKLTYELQVKELKQQVEELAKENITTSAIRKHVFMLAEHPLKPPKWLHTSTPQKGSPGVPTLFISDFHWGEVVYKNNVNNLNSYNRKIARERVSFVVNSAIDLCTNHMVNPKYPGIVVPLGGDMISGSIHDELIETNDGTSIEHVIELVDVLSSAIAKLADVFGNVFVPCVIGNHSRMYKQYRHKQAVESSFDWLLYNMLEKYFSKDKRVNFLIPSTYDASYKIYNTSYLLTHGDRLGVRGGTGIIGMIGPIARGVQKVKTEYANVKQSIDYVLMGHFHQYLSLKDAIVNGSVIGYNEYAMSGRFSFEKPQQALWFTHPVYGVTFQVPVHCEQGSVKKPKNTWVSWHN